MNRAGVATECNGFDGLALLTKLFEACRESCNQCLLGFNLLLRLVCSGLPAGRCGRRRPLPLRKLVGQPVGNFLGYWLHRLDSATGFQRPDLAGEGEPAGAGASHGGKIGEVCQLRVIGGTALWRLMY